MNEARRRTDILVVGAGPAGMAAAVRAAESGRSVTLLDDNPAPGGQIWRGGNSRVPWFGKLEVSRVQVINGARVISGDCKSLTVELYDSAFEIDFQQLILATGARELFLPFPGWTSPNVIGVGGLQALVKSGLPVAGKRIVVAGSGPFLLAAAGYLQRHGAAIPLVAEQASRSQLIRFAKTLLRYPRRVWQAAALRVSLRGSRYLSSCWVESIDGNVVTLRKDATVWQERCDYLATGFGFQPNAELAALLGCSKAVNEFQQTSSKNIYSAGECTGIGGVDLAIVEGEIAGYSVAGRMHEARRLFPRRARASRFAAALDRAFALRNELRGLATSETIVCRCEDVRWGQLQTARSRREAKLYTRCGMGPCQGRVCGSILDFLIGPEFDTVRPPVFPARLGSLTIEEEKIPE